MGAFEIYDETYDIHELPRWERFTKDNDFMMLFREIPMKSPNVTDRRRKR